MVFTAFARNWFRQRWGFLFCFSRTYTRIPGQQQSVVQWFPEAEVVSLYFTAADGFLYSFPNPGKLSRSSFRVAKRSCVLQLHVWRANTFLVLNCYHLVSFGVSWFSCKCGDALFTIKAWVVKGSLSHPRSEAYQSIFVPYMWKVFYTL